MRGEYIRELIDRIDVRRGVEYSRYQNAKPVSDSKDDADRDLAIGRFLFLNSNYDESIKSYESAIRKYRRLEDRIGECYALIYLSMNYREMQDVSASRRILRRANDLGLSIRDNYAVLFAIINSLMLYSMEGRSEEAELLRVRAGAMVEDVGHPKLGGDYHNNTGRSLLDMDRLDESLMHLQMAYKLYLQHYGDESVINLIVVRINTVLALTKMKRYEEALEEIEKLENIVGKLGYDSNLSFEIYMRKMELYEEMKDFKNAYAYGKLSIENRKKWLDETTMKPRKENLELRQGLEIFQEKLFANNEELKRNNALLEEVIKNNELVRKIGSKLTATYELDQIFEIISSEVKQVLPFNSLSVSTVEDDEIVIRHAILIDVPQIELPYRLPLNSKEYMLAYCVNHNVDIKINRRVEFAEYVPTKYAEVIANSANTDTPDNEFAIYCRLMQDGKPIGVFSIQNDLRDSYGELEFDAIKAIASFVSIAIINWKKNMMIQEKARQLEKLTLMDPLTKLGNRRAYRLAVEELQKSGQPYALLFGDLNHLKVVNDNFGHEQGDRYLLSVAEVLQAECQGSEVFRLSGDEFASLLIGVKREELSRVVERIKFVCAQRSIGPYPLSLAIGCAFSNCYTTENILFMKAEARMYLDKHDYYRRYGAAIERRDR
ncbi:MAG: GGDEF domain-containing protein [Bacillota bacterium]|nr:GGDEF domain-containing protein [Bacillota bacterium]